jgi:predicted MFS family arabinose efflux permease
VTVAVVEAGAARAPVLGLRANAAQFSLLVLVNAFVGAMVGMERSILAPLAEVEFGLNEFAGYLAVAASALLAGVVADAFGAGAAVWLVAALTLLSGVTVALRMRETLRR